MSFDALSLTLGTCRWAYVVYYDTEKVLQEVQYSDLSF